MAQAPHIYCKNQDCKNADGKQPIPLPYPIQPKTNQHPSVWPPACFEVNIACPECDRVFLYKKQDVRWRPSPPTDQGQDQTSTYKNAEWWLVGFPCAGKNCKIRVEFLAMTREGETVGVVHEKLPRGAYDGKCKKGHAYANRGIGPYTVTQFFEFEGS